jgi:hypothetical protein
LVALISKSQCNTFIHLINEHADKVIEAAQEKEKKDYEKSKAAGEKRETE